MQYSISRDFGKLNRDMVINNEFNKIQINETLDRDSNGNTLRRSMMINIRANSVEEADKLYRQLKAKLNSKAVDRKDGENRPAGNTGNGKTTICQCGKAMILKQGRRGPFYSCSGYPQCRITKDWSDGSDEVVVNVDEIRVEDIQF